MATEPITNFSDRLNAVADALRMTGAVPSAAKVMQDADGKITDVLDMFDASTNARTLDTFAEDGRKWAKNPTKGGLERLIETLDAPVGSAATTVPVRVKEPWGETWQNVTASTPHGRRLAAARKGALNGLIAKFDKPAFSTAALIESCKDDVRAWFDRQVKEYYEAWEGLDDVAKDAVRNDPHGDAGRTVFDLIDPAHTPEATITAYRRFARVWAVLLDDETSAYVRLARAMAFNDVSETPDSDRDLFDRLEKLTRSRARGVAPLYDATTCALRALGMNATKAVALGVGRVAPLADPLGEDFPELERRCEVIRAAEAWLDHRMFTVGDRYHGKGWHEDYERYGMVDPLDSLAALKEFNPEVLPAEPADIDADADE